MKHSKIIVCVVLERKILKQKNCQKFFPWISSEGLETATYTDSKVEGWIDPHMFHAALKNKAIELGAIFEKKRN